MKFLDGAISGAGVLLAITNALGGIVAGIWLLILGDWGSLGYGLLFAFLGKWAIGLAMMPGMIFVLPAAALLKRGNRFGFFSFATVSMVYQTAVLSLWCLLTLKFFVLRADSASLAPYLLWAYGVATAPINYLAHQDLQSGNEHGAITAMFCQLGLIVIGAAMLVSSPTIQTVVLIFAAFMVVAMTIRGWIAISQ